MANAWATGDVKLPRLAVASVLAVACGCGGKARSAEAPLVVADGAAVGAADGEDGARAPAPDAACIEQCGDRYPGARPYVGYREYCEEVCTPPSEASAQCVTSCEKSHEPGAHYDGDGEYVEDEDPRDEAQRQADRASCEEECATVPEVSDAGMAACVGACTTDGRNESACQAECDPDPYDQCRYAPCD